MSRSKEQRFQAAGKEREKIGKTVVKHAGVGPGRIGRKKELTIKSLSEIIFFLRYIERKEERKKRADNKNPEQTAG